MMARAGEASGIRPQFGGPGVSSEFASASDLTRATVVAARLVHWRTFRREASIYAHSTSWWEPPAMEPPEGESCGSSLARVSDLPFRGAKAMQEQKRSQTEMDAAAAEGGDCVIQLRDLGDGNVHLRIVQALPASLAKQIGSLLASTPEGKRVLH